MPLATGRSIKNNSAPHHDRKRCHRYLSLVPEPSDGGFDSWMAMAEIGGRSDRWIGAGTGAGAGAYPVKKGAERERRRRTVAGRATATATIVRVLGGVRKVVVFFKGYKLQIFRRFASRRGGE